MKIDKVFFKTATWFLLKGAWKVFKFSLWLMLSLVFAPSSKKYEYNEDTRPLTIDEHFRGGKHIY